jgi:hypothetical protein
MLNIAIRRGRGARWTSLFLALASSIVSAEEAKKDQTKKPQPPRLAVALPLGLIPGATNEIRLRGLNLTNVTELRFADPAPDFRLAVKTKSTVGVPQGTETNKVGDTQIEVEISVPRDAPPATNAIVAVNADGESAPFALITLPIAAFVEEREPNPGFGRFQEIQFGQIVRGSIKDAGDVDVFGFSGNAGQTVRVEVRASRMGAALDSIVTLYDHAGHPVAVNDDSEAGRDSILKARLPAAGRYFICLQEAQDRGGALHAYLLRLERVE